MVEISISRIRDNPCFFFNVENYFLGDTVAVEVSTCKDFHHLEGIRGSFFLYPHLALHRTFEFIRVVVSVP
jgi:hypothetical protein